MRVRGGWCSVGAGGGQGLVRRRVVMRPEWRVWWRAEKRMWGLQWVQSGGMDMWWGGIPALMSWSRMSAGMSAWGRGVVGEPEGCWG